MYLDQIYIIMLYVGFVDDSGSSDARETLIDWVLNRIIYEYTHGL